MNTEERDEIAAAVAAHGELGTRYDSAIAEGLIERIGDEIDKRVEARLRGQQPAPAPVPPPRPVSPAAPGQQSGVAQRHNLGITGTILGLGSMGIGIGATAVVVTNVHSGFAEVLMILLIWAAIAVVNIAHSQRR